MTDRKSARNEALVPVDLIVRGKSRAVLLVDISLGGAQFEVPGDLILDHGEAVLIKPEKLPSAVAYVRWSREEHLGVEFRHQLHPTLLDFVVARANSGLDLNLDEGGDPVSRAA